MKQEGRDNPEIYAFLNCLRNPETVQRVISDTSDIHALLLKELPPLKCPDCTSCPWKGKTCMRPEQDDLYIRIASHMKQENVSQEELLNLLRPFYQSF